MTLKEIHDRVLFDLNKEQVGYVSHEQIDLALDRAQMAEFEDLFGNPEEYPMPRKAYGVTERINEALNPFKVLHSFTSSSITSTNFNGTGPNGQIIMPEDYIHWLSMYTTAGNKIDVVKEDELPGRIRSSIIAPSTIKPVAVLEGKGGTIGSIDIGDRVKFKLYPEFSTISGKVWYLRRPAKPNYVANISGRTISYVHATSTQMEWDDVSLERIINKAVGYIARFLQSPADVNYSEMKADKGL